ncbi:isoprenylcysteine carboxylmethyltransferase family protein [Vibrio lamellibrachiae]|uniref:methyltransferase family protein n=1 Tax=Vibrio lamellibrachiae TaxID=2910253 RepID=UPI003D0AD34E
MNKFELKIPPVAVFLIVALMMSYMKKSMLFAHVYLPLAWVVFLSCFIIATVIALSGVREFRRAQTTVNPVKPETASSIVDSGIFSYTRNPMYLGLFIFLFGIGYWQQNWISLAMSYSFVLYMNHFQIKPEERALEKIFGAEYMDYKQRVRRWV